MKSRTACLAAAFFLLSPTGAYRSALPGYRYQFPRDHFNHPAFQTEWWYYTGNLTSPDGHCFGFELTFFRSAIDRDPAKNRPWDIRDLYLAHLALSDLDGRKFYHAERTNRAGPGLAGISESAGRIWNGNWETRWRRDRQELQAITGDFEIHLTLRSEKRPVIHGVNGVSQKAEGVGRASHYISLTRLQANGRIEVAGRKFEVAGLSWMDHEFFTHQLAVDQVGWDWMSLQLDDGTELMLFHIRRKDGSIDSHSAGTFVDARGATTHLSSDEFALQPAGESWTRPNSQASYPVHWRVSVPTLRLTLDATTLLPSQEMPGNSRLAPTYWEGAVTLAGHRGTSGIAGAGYLEMTGYDRPVEMGP